ncbi:hypothetical protein H0H93_013621, partial [Arthromyces matolae]
RIWYRPAGWENIEERVRVALKSGVPERIPKQSRTLRKLLPPAWADSPSSSKEAKFPMQPTSPMHEHPGLNVDPKDKMHPHHSTLDPHPNLRTGPNSFDFNAPLMHKYHYPGLNIDRTVHPHDSTLDPHPNLRTGPNSFDFNAPLMHNHPGLNIDRTVHPHDSTLDPHINLHPGSNSFDFNAPLSHPSPNPMVSAPAVNPGFQVPSFFDSHFLHPLHASDYRDMDPQLIDPSH